MRASHLFEAINYEQMFDKKFTDFISEMFGINGEAEVKNFIRAAKTRLKRSDRIVWYLRLVKMTMLAQAWSFAPHKIIRDGGEKDTAKLAKIAVANQENKPSILKDWYAYIDSEFKKFNSKTKGKKHHPEKFAMIYPWHIADFATTPKYAVEAYTGPLTSVLNDMDHFLSLPITKINDYTFEWQEWETINDVFRDLENEWKESRKSIIPIKDSDAIFLDVGDDFYWVDLQKTGCSEEGQAMGHCGNTPMGNHPDITILSLRQKVKDQKDVSMWKPWATFIFNKKKGTFGEMKGRGNEKPDNKYHKYIIPLLLDKRIKGLEGGGYAPENNFSIKDLPEATWKSLVKKKPDLLNDFEYIKSISSTDARAKNALKKLLGGLTRDGNSLIISEDDNIGKYVKYNHVKNNAMSKLAWALDVFQGNTHMEWNMTWKDARYSMKNVLSKEEDNKLEKLEEENNEKYTDIEHDLVLAYEEAINSGTESEMYAAFKDAVTSPLKNAEYTDADMFALTFADPKNLLDSKVSITMPLSEIETFLNDESIESMEDLESHISEMAHGIYIDFEEPYYGFDGFDDAHWESEKKRILDAI